MNGNRAGGTVFRRRVSPALAASWFAMLLPLAAVPAQDPVPGDELERLRAMLAEPGPDGREARATAIERLLAMPQPAAHRVLQQVLGLDTDPDGVRLAILAALERHLRATAAGQFGGAAADVRREILTGYVAVLARFWRAEPAAFEVPLGLEGAAARLALQKLNAREFEETLRSLLGAADGPTKASLFRCTADMQQLYLAQVLAEYLADEDANVRAVARGALRLLTFHDVPFATKEQFAEWFAGQRDVRYVDLAERAARDADRRAERAREEQTRIRIDAAREFVRAHTLRKPGIDWAEIQARTLVDDPAVLDACLELLQQALAQGLPADDAPPARQAFCRALLQRWRAVAPDQVRRRSLLLEVAACTARPDETELATELVGLLLAQLEGKTADEQVAALRGLRRFPTVDTRTRIVRYATALLPSGPAVRPQLEVAIATLSARTPPRWFAPADTDPDKSEWLALVKSLCSSPQWTDLRDVALQLALIPDARDQRVAEAFAALLDFAKDRNLDSKFRSNCLLQLQGWRDQRSLADGWVQAMHELLDDMAPDIRQLAAESLARVTEAVDNRRAQWITSTIFALRDHLRSETSPNVLRALVDTMQVCGREPQMPEKAIGALNAVLGELGDPVPPEHQFRLEPLLATLATIAGDARADRGQWLGACRQLARHEKRPSLRLVLLNHAAVDLAKEVASAEGSQAERAREAMRWLIVVALQKPPREAWTDSEDLQREARDVRVAFNALDTLDESQRLDEPRHRLLRLEVELVGGKFREVVERATAWLGNGSTPVAPGTARQPFSAEQRDRMRILLAEAHLGLNKPELAAKALADRDGDQSADVRLTDLQARIGKALAATDPAASLALLARALKATPPEDPQFRTRLVEWASASVRLDPGARQAILVELDRHAALFEAQDCPSELRDAFVQLRGQR